MPDGGDGGGGEGGGGFGAGVGDFGGDVAGGMGGSGAGFEGGLAGLGDFGGMSGDPGFGVGYGAGAGGDIGYGGGPGAPQFAGGMRPPLAQPQAQPPPAAPAPTFTNHPNFNVPTAVARPGVQRSPLLEMAKPILSNMTQNDWQNVLKGIYMGTG